MDTLWFYCAEDLEGVNGCRGGCCNFPASKFGFFSHLLFDLEKNGSLYWASETKDLHFVSSRRIYSTERALSTTELMWTVVIDLIWLVGCSALTWFQSLFRPRLFGSFQEHSLHNAGGMEHSYPARSRDEQTASSFSISFVFRGNCDLRNTPIATYHNFNRCQERRAEDFRHWLHGWQSIARIQSFAVYGCCCTKAQAWKLKGDSEVERDTSSERYNWSCDSSWKERKRVGC